MSGQVRGIYKKGIARSWGSDPSAVQLMRNVLEQTGHPQCVKGSVARDEIAATAGVSVAADGAVTGR
jgi:hypothetical protein